MSLRIDIVCAQPNLINPLLGVSIVGRAVQSGVVEFHVHNLHDYATDKFRHIDDEPYGGGAGMIIKCQPLFDCIELLKSTRAYDEIIYLTPDGSQLTQETANELSMKQNLMMIAGHYKGIDQRVRDALVTREISIGDYVLTGGELPALVLCDAITRVLPGAIGDAESALGDSFQDGLLAPPHYTRPASYRGLDVPEVLLSGNHSAIGKWRQEEALKKTEERRPDLLQ